MKKFLLRLFFLTLFLKGGITIVTDDCVKTKVDRKGWVYLNDVKVCHWDDVLDIHSDAVDNAERLNS